MKRTRDKRPSSQLKHDLRRLAANAAPSVEKFWLVGILLANLVADLRPRLCNDIFLLGERTNVHFLVCDNQGVCTDDVTSALHVCLIDTLVSLIRSNSYLRRMIDENRTLRVENLRVEIEDGAVIDLSRLPGTTVYECLAHRHRPDTRLCVWIELT